ncbi:MAG: metallopeptidase TldD-related protein [Candidatus Neomarinimicrobiota bacterium]|nr:metallopeptidase TldD-related protein [Candidatus Neomarinimicrobiota bacterium]|tara:strand:- start:72 stop:1412 length:1341 start_codon:yes stop_codon:yes gene_type:complete
MKKEIYNNICSQVYSTLKEGEDLTIYMEGENSQYFRFNDSKIRQTGIIEDYNVTLSLYHGKKSLQATTTVSSDIDYSVKNLISEIDGLREPLSLIPENNFTAFPDKFDSLEVYRDGELPNREEILDSLMSIIDKDNLTGVWTSGKIFRASSTSQGTQHWFEKDSFIFDFSLIDAKENMVKILYPGSDWNKDDFITAFDDASNRLQLMDKPKLELKPGKYRVWFEPHAVADFVDMLNWNGVSEASLRNGSSCLLKMRKDNVKLSEKFSLDESFDRKSTASFNSRSEVSANVSLIKHGMLENTLINSKTALEYGLTSNYAEDVNSWGMGEYLRAPFMHGGDIKLDERLEKLGTGIFISNIHYLNWSDNLGGRITGLTRYACYWVEDGKMIAPIKTMRFDDSFYNFFGNNLEAVGETLLSRPVIETYDGRNPGETTCPGILVNDFELTL